MIFLMVDVGEPWPRLYGPFIDEDSAMAWAEANVPKNDWTYAAPEGA